MIQDVSRLSSLRVGLVSGGLALGGATTFLCNFAGELIRRKIPVEVFSFEQANPLASDFERLGIPTFSLDEHRLIFEDRMSATLQQLKKFQPSVVMANLGATSFEVLRHVPEGVMRIGIIHSDHPSVYEMAGHYLPVLDAVAVVSKTIRQKMDTTWAASKVPVHYLPLGVPMPEENRRTARNRQSPLRILYLGRLQREQKRAQLFPVIWQQLITSGIPFHWTLAGDGPERHSLEQAMRSPNPGQTVSFTGKISYAEVPKLADDHDVFLLASDHEGLPLSLLEAMGHGLVPVVSDLESGIPEVVDASNGMLVRVDDVEGYARAIIHLHEQREELAAKSAAAQARVQAEISTAAMTDRWLAAFPPTAQAIAAWPRTFDIQAPLTDRRNFFYSKPVRVLRRLVKVGF